LEHFDLNRAANDLNSMSLSKRFKQFDVYRDIPSEYTEQTISGAAVSVMAILVMVVLFASEFISYLTPEMTSEMFVDGSFANEKGQMLQINMNITVPHMPCAVVSIDAQDVMGSHVLDVGGRLHKTRVDRHGVPRVDSEGRPLPIDTRSGSVLQDQVGEGCNVHGFMLVKKVPGNFHVSAHSHANLLPIFFPNGPMNTTHIIHDISFGEKNEEVASVFDQAVISPLSGLTQNAIVPNNVRGEAVSYEYYIKIVPTKYEKLDGSVVDSYQYVSNHNDVVGRYRVPAVYFRYELSPITVKFAQRRKSFTHFLVQVCAIVGGVFTVLGLINSVVRSSLRQLKKKAEINKLG